MHMERTYFETICQVFNVIFDVMKNSDTPVHVIVLLLVPIFISFLNIHVHFLLEKEDKSFFQCIACKILYDYMSFIVQSDINYVQTRKIYDKLLLRLNMAKIKCGTPIPGINQRQHKDLLKNSSKLMDFLFVIPILWNTIISFGISIYFMETHSEYPIRLIFTFMCISVVFILTSITDPLLYEKTKASNTKITTFNESEMVKLKISMGCKMDIMYEFDKQKKQKSQQTIQKYCICFINIVITILSLASKNNGQLHSFSKISWMLGCLADNLKSLMYYEYMSEFFTLTKCLESHELVSSNEIPIGLIDKITFDKVSFGYYSNDLTKNSEKIFKINKLSYELKKGTFYYIEAPNGFGKSTFLKSFTSNLFEGDIYFGSVNRKNLTFEDVHSNIFHMVQATEYTPKFDPVEIEHYNGKDSWLEEKLGLTGLLGKDMIELSGGQKKRVYIRLALDSQIILLDEILSELDTEETPEVPEGGGWLTRVINTLAEWPGIKHKILILVGHGLVELMPSNVVKLVIENTIDNNGEKKTVIRKRNISL